jgi:putative addiction module CopG family antidote
MSVIIPAEFERFVEESVSSGRYRTKSELIVDALQLLRDRERRWDALRDDIHAGLEELESGVKFPLNFDEIKRHGRELLLKPTTES